MDATAQNPLLAARTKAKLRRIHVAASLNVSTQTVYNWERGLTCPDVGRAAEIAGVLGIPVDVVIGYIVALREGRISERGAA